MTITLYTNQSERNVVSKNLVQLAELTGTLREGCSITDPSILIDSGALPSNTISNCNYAYIPDFNRYYYVNEIKLESTGAWRFSMHVDVLKNADTQLRASSAVIRRTQDINRANLYIADDTYKAEQKKKIQTLEMEEDDNYCGFRKSGNYVVTVFGVQQAENEE